MSEQAQALLRDALALPVSDRAELVTDLLSSLEDAHDDPVSVREAWVAELERRARRAHDGSSPTRDWSEVRDGLRRQLADG